MALGRDPRSRHHGGCQFITDGLARLDVAGAVHDHVPQRRVGAMVDASRSSLSSSTILTARASDSIGISSSAGRPCLWCKRSKSGRRSANTSC
jgi:hypothetical protein